MCSSDLNSPTNQATATRVITSFTAMRAEPSTLALNSLLLLLLLITSPVSALPMTPRQEPGVKPVSPTTSDHHIISPLTTLLKTEHDRQHARAQERMRIDSGATQLTRVSAYQIDTEGNRITKRGESRGLTLGFGVEEEGGLDGIEGQDAEENAPLKPRAAGAAGKQVG